MRHWGWSCGQGTSRLRTVLGRDVSAKNMEEKRERYETLLSRRRGGMGAWRTPLEEGGIERVMGSS